MKKILPLVAAFALVLGTAQMAVADHHEGAAAKAGDAIKKEAEKEWDGMSYKDGEKPGDLWDKKNPCAPKANPCAPKANPCAGKK